MLHLVLGSAGTGKSSYISSLIERDVAQGKEAYLIIPEQQANLSERTMLPHLPERAGLTFTIAGFTKLYERIAARYGGITTRPPDRALKMLLLWECMRELSPLLEEYRIPADTPPDGALIALLLQTLEELQCSAVSPSHLETAAARLPEGTPLPRKLRDIALLYATYEARIASVSESDGSDTVSQLAQLLQKHRCFVESNVYIDSFTDFTAEEYHVLQELIGSADNVTVALCCDGLTDSIPAFACAAATARRLLQISREQDVPVHYTQLRENRRTSSPELCRLERYLWDLSYQSCEDDLPLPDERGDITLLRCADIYAEAEAAALHVLHQLHRGTSYGEIAIIVRDTEAYRGVLDAALERHGIPFYFSDKTTLADKPLCRFLLSALRAVAYRFPTQDILTMTKTGLLHTSEADLDLFEQYVDTWSINGNDFLAERWVKNPDGYTDRLHERGTQILAAANRVREALIGPLLRLYTALHADPSLPSACRALYDYMAEMQLADRCAAIAEGELTAGYLKEAGETLRIYDTVTDTLAQLSAALPDVRVTPSELHAALQMLFAQSELASVPSLHDSVTIGAADTLRVENVAVCLVLGLGESEFPRAISDTGLLSEADKQQLAALDIPLDNSGELRSSRELMYVWRAMTKPSHALIVSTVAASMDGSAKSPGIAYDRLLYLFPYLKEQIMHFDLSLLHQPHADAPIASETAAPQPAPDPEGGSTDYTPHLPSPDDITPERASALLGDTLYLTQSRIQTFVQCPFRFYCTYMLQLRERQVAAIDYADSGTFFHFLLEKVLRECLDAQGHFVAPAEAEIEPLADRFVNQYLRALLASCDTDATRSARIMHLFSRLRALALVLLRDVLGELSHSKFLPSAFELRIGARSPDAPAPYCIDLDDGSRILLGGTVDRVDAYTQDGKLYLRVVDYKSGSKSFSLDDVRKGFNLQLLIYLFALCRAGESGATPLPAGALYISTKEVNGVVHTERSCLLLDNPDVLLAMNDESDPHYLAGIRADAEGNLRGGALTDLDEFSALERDVRATLRAIGQDMRSGRAAKATDPTACAFCPLKGHCAGASPIQ
ncbi:MAG: PD-(D/E)XK nuclease family protein, partial [Clostridia bacterium]|nr:PD-(D/E)XK nuclease family protein [Clostridia bacterium]